MPFDPFQGLDPNDPEEFIRRLMTMNQPKQGGNANVSSEFTRLPTIGSPYFSASVTNNLERLPLIPSPYFSTSVSANQDPIQLLMSELAKTIYSPTLVETDRQKVPMILDQLKTEIMNKPLSPQTQTDIGMNRSASTDLNQLDSIRQKFPGLTQMTPTTTNPNAGPGAPMGSPGYNPGAIPQDQGPIQNQGPKAPFQYAHPKLSMLAQILQGASPAIGAAIGGTRVGYGMLQGQQQQQQLAMDQRKMAQQAATQRSQQQNLESEIKNREEQRRLQERGYLDAEEERKLRREELKAQKNQALVSTAMDDFRTQLSGIDTTDEAAIGDLATSIAQVHNLTPEDQTRFFKVASAVTALKRRPKEKTAAEKQTSDALQSYADLIGKPVEQLNATDRRNADHLDKAGGSTSWVGAVVRDTGKFPTAKQITDHDVATWQGKMQGAPYAYEAQNDASGKLVGYVNKTTGDFRPLNAQVAAAGGLYKGTGNLPQTASDQLYGMSTSLDQLAGIIPKLETYKGFGPVAGRVTLAEVKTLGGLGASKEDLELAVRLHRLVTSEAFANGGKQLTITELQQFKELNPTLSDTLDNALIKAKRSEEFLKTALRNRIQSLAPRDQENVDPRIRARVGFTSAGQQNPQGGATKIERYDRNGNLIP